MTFSLDENFLLIYYQLINNNLIRGYYQFILTVNIIYIQ